MNLVGSDALIVLLTRMVERSIVVLKNRSIASGMMGSVGGNLGWRKEIGAPSKSVISSMSMGVEVRVDLSGTAVGAGLTGEVLTGSPTEGTGGVDMMEKNVCGGGGGLIFLF